MNDKYIKILIGFFEAIGNLFVLFFFLALWLSLTYLLSNYISKLPIIFILGWILGGFILAINSIRINWFPFYKILKWLVVK